jgi:hypothetical protein
MTDSRKPAPAGAAARHVRVRLAGLDPDTLAHVAELLADVAETGPVSAPYADRRGPGFRLYLDLYMPEHTDRPPKEG